MQGRGRGPLHIKSVALGELGELGEVGEVGEVSPGGSHPQPPHATSDPAPRPRPHSFPSWRAETHTRPEYLRGPEWAVGHEKWAGMMLKLPLVSDHGEP